MSEGRRKTHIMKTPLILLALALAAAGTAQAQLFRPETVRGAAVGGIAGAVIGHNNGHRGWEGAAYGAAAGAIIGTIVGESRDSRGYRPPYSYHHSRYAGYRGHAHRPIVVRPLVPVLRLHPIHPGYRHPSVHYRGPVRRPGVVLAVPVRPHHRRHDHDRSDHHRRISARERVNDHTHAAGRAAATAYPEQVTVINHHHYYGTSAPRPMAPASRLFGR